MPTTSQPQRRTSSSRGSTPRSGPLKGVRLKVTLTGPGAKELARLAEGKGLDVEDKDGAVHLAISTATPEDALEKLGLFSRILAARA